MTTNHDQKEGMNLVNSALAVVGSPQALVDAINGDLGARYDTQRLWNWGHGRRSIPQPVQDWMLRTAAPWAVRQVGGDIPWTDEAADALAAHLCPPARQG